MRLGWAVLLAAVGSIAPAGCGADPPLEVAQSVDLSRFQGKWYEIARLPRTTQADCYGTTAFYTQNPDGTLSFVNQCNVGAPAGPLNTVSMIASVTNGAQPAKLALTVGTFSGDYWILEVGPDYEYAVVGHPSREYLWILSRAPTLDSTTLQGIVARAQSQQFDMTRLEYTPQPPGSERESAPTPVGPVPPAVTTGCSASARPLRAHDGAWALSAAAAALALVAARSKRAAPRSKAAKRAIRPGLH